MHAKYDFNVSTSFNNCMFWTFNNTKAVRMSKKMFLDLFSMHS